MKWSVFLYVRVETDLNDSLKHWREMLAPLNQTRGSGSMSTSSTLVSRPFHLWLTDVFFFFLPICFVFFSSEYPEQDDRKADLMSINYTLLSLWSLRFPF